ncbi:MAG: glutamine-hydrolyzing carbamoyl-phosphate synthase small subunit [Gammaproteobacteria bacterium]|nr:glutamine-hydrolyzing carbamoyl-phosphate synthase small subunit [Gammaproteobacteria bacterium]
MTQQAVLALEDGSLFYGQSVGATGQTTGEVVFNTSMTGYQEILTDPSYAKQIVTLTFPHIGNTGVNSVDEESLQPMAAGLIIRDSSMLHSNWRSNGSLHEYLQRHGIVAIAGVDTRRLTRILREKGAQGGCIVAGRQADDNLALANARAYPGMQGQDLASVVTTSRPYEWSQGSYELDSVNWKSTPPRFQVVAYDFGIKLNILRMLSDRGCHVTVVPATTPASEVLALQPDGIFLSNGPGDPEPCDYAIEAIQKILATNVPVFGICLGVQLLGLAAGAKTIKMKFGHHGANHPVQDLDTKQVLITSQNHGFALNEETLPDNIRATHRSLFDNSLQGIELNDGQAFGFQGHPEASPGPHDIAPLFDRFITLMKTRG